MSLKKLFGLESFGISDEEISRKMQEASRNQMEEVEFKSNNQRIRVKLHKVKKEGMMRVYWDYYN